MIKVLVADDSNLIQKAIRIALAKAGTEIICAPTDTRAREITQSWSPDAIYLSASLPDLQLSAWHASPLNTIYKTKVTLVEGSFSQFLGGASGQEPRARLRKPFTADQIVQSLQTVCGTPARPSFIRSTPVTPPAAASEPSKSRGPVDMPASFWSMPADVQEQFKQKMDQVAREYCREHFTAIAREVVTSELRRLQKERARALDNPTR